MRVSRHNRAWIVKLSLSIAVHSAPYEYLPQLRSDGRLMTNAEKRAAAIELFYAGHYPPHHRRALMDSWIQPRLMRWLNERRPGSHYYSDELLGNIDEAEGDYLIGRLLLEYDRIRLEYSHRRVYAN